jgi:hypothetical protein
MYKKEIITYDIVFTEEEHARMIALRNSIRQEIAKPMYQEETVLRFLAELEQILEGEWSPQMPF